MTGVVVAGAGPTALLLAGDLAAAGVDVTVLERRRDESPLTRAFAVHARTLEQLDARGLADDLVATGTTVDEFRLFGSVSVNLTELPSRYPYLLVTPQYHVERALLSRAQAAGARIRRGVHVDAVRDTGDAVTVGWTGDDGTTGETDAAYVVGADGHHSTVRTQLGLDFPGEPVVRSLMLADVRMTDPPPDVLTVDGNEYGFCFVVPYGDGWYRVIAPAGRRVRGMLTGIGFSYARAAGDHRLVGNRMPDVTDPGGVRLHEALRGGRFVLVGPAALHRPGGVLPFEVPAGPARLVRPDGYVGWAGEDRPGLTAALDRWGAVDAGPAERAPSTPEVPA